MNDFPNTTPGATAAPEFALTPTTAPWLCAQQLILTRAHEMARYEEGARQGEDLEALHDMRVWSRRLREALEIFAFCFPQKTYRKIYARVRQVTKALGRAREADVAMEFFSQRHAAAEDLVEQFSLQDLLMRLVETQQDQRAKMQSRLDRKVKAAALPQELAAAFQRLAFQPVSRRRGPRLAVRLARSLLSQRLNQVFAARRAITGAADVTGLHNLRIAVKKLRYALETLEFAAGEHVAANLKFFKKLQTVLGDLHDRDVFRAAVQERLGKLQSKSYSALLCQGYERILTGLAQERQAFYQEYDSLFAGARLADWRKLVVPPLPAPPRPETPLETERQVTPDSELPVPAGSAPA